MCAGVEMGLHDGVWKSDLHHGNRTYNISKTIVYPADARDGEEEQAHKVAIVLEVHVVHHQQARAPEHQRRQQQELWRTVLLPPLALPAAARVGPHPHQEQEVRNHDAPALEGHGGVADIGLWGDAEEARVVAAAEAVGGPGEEAFEVGEEGGVVQGPLGGGLEVPGYVGYGVCVWLCGVDASG